MSTRIYKWDEWFSRRHVVLRRGREYNCSQSSMAQQIRNAASARQLSVVIMDQVDQFVVLVMNADQPRGATNAHRN